MWDRRNKVWLQFRRDIISADIPSGIFLADYLRHVAIQRIHTHHLEIIDLQRYKVISTPKKVRAALTERSEIPFIFITGKN